jgi:AMIN domain
MTQAIRPSRRAALRSMGSTALLLTAPQLAWGAAIVAVRVWPAKDYTRVTVESDQKLAATHLLIDTPHRLVVDRCDPTTPSSPACAWANFSPAWCVWCLT